MNSAHKQQNGPDEEDFLFAMQLATGSMLSMAMQVAVELNLFDIIAKAGPGAQLSAADIASQLSTQNPEAPAMLDRILRLLASHSVLTATTTEHPDGVVQRLYGLETVCKFFITNENGVSLSPFLLLCQDKASTATWYTMKDSIVEGGAAFEKAHGVGVFKYAEAEPRYNQVFQRAMLNHTTIVMAKVLETYKGFDDLKSIVDVGGGIGTALSMIAAKYPATKCVNFDLPHVVRHAPSYPGVEHVGGDMFESVPSCEAIFMKWVPHALDDKQCLKLFKNCYKALPEHGKAIVMEGIVPAAVTTDDATKGLFQMDTAMLKYGGSVKERTEKEFDALAKEAGFAGMEKACCVCNFWVMEFLKK